MRGKADCGFAFLCYLMGWGACWRKGAAHMDIEHHIDGSKGRITAKIGIGPVAEMTYSAAGARLIIIDHTEVPDVYRGQGVGLAMVEHAVEMARESGRMILPLCPFAAAQFRRHPEWGDVLNRSASKGEAG